MEEESVVQDDLTLAEGQDSNLDEQPEDVEAIKEKLAKAEELARNQKIRAEKAEALAKTLKKPPEKHAENPTPKNELSLKDIRALQDVHDDDVDQVTEYAKFKGVSVAEAKKDPVIQSLLRVRGEERKTAEATNVAGARKGTTKVSEADLAQKFYDNDDNLSEEERANVVRARLNNLTKH